VVRAHRDRRPELERVKHAGKRRVPPDEPSENEPAREPGYGAADRNGVGIRDRRAIERPELRGVAAHGGPTDSKAVVTRGFPRDEERHRPGQLGRHTAGARAKRSRWQGRRDSTCRAREAQRASAPPARGRERRPRRGRAPGRFASRRSRRLRRPVRGVPVRRGPARTPPTPALPLHRSRSAPGAALRQVRSGRRTNDGRRRVEPRSW